MFCSVCLGGHGLSLVSTHISRQSHVCCSLGTSSLAVNWQDQLFLGSRKSPTANTTWTGLRSSRVSNVFTPAKVKEKLVSCESAFVWLPKGWWWTQNQGQCLHSTSLRVPMETAWPAMLESRNIREDVFLDYNACFFFVDVGVWAAHLWQIIKHPSFFSSG